MWTQKWGVEGGFRANAKILVFTLTRIKEFLVLRIQKHVIIKDSNFSIKPRFKIFAFDDNDAGLEAVAGHGTFLFARHRDTRRVPLQL